RTITLGDTTANTTGKLTLQFSAQADGGYTATASPIVTVAQPALTVRLNGPRRGASSAELAYQVKLTNPGREASLDIDVSLTLPEGLQFVSASHQGKHDEATHRLTWAAGTLDRGQRQTVTFRVRATMAGDWAISVTAQAKGGTAARATHAVAVEAGPTLFLELSANDDPI